MSDFEVRQRLQTSSNGEGHQLLKWINSREVAERLADPTISVAPSGTCLLQSGPWAYRNPSLNVPTMSAFIYVAERNDIDTILTIAVKHPSYKQMAVVLRLSVSNDVLRSCAPAARKTLAYHLVSAMNLGLNSNGMIAIRGPILAAHPVSNQQVYRRDAWLEESIQGKIRKREALFSYGA